MNKSSIKTLRFRIEQPFQMKLPVRPLRKDFLVSAPDTRYSLVG